MDWAKDFYSITGKWWGPAEWKITKRDYDRAETVKRFCPNAKTILELGCGYGNTAIACAEKGFAVSAIEISDRIDFSNKFESGKFYSSVKFIKEDFYKVQLREQFDAVCYWNSFGIGDDEDQKKLLKRISDEWLKPGGIALIDVQNPIVWAKWAGEKTDKKARPEEGYSYNVSEEISFDFVQNRFRDTWWETDHPEEKISQNLKCYSPGDLRLLLEGTGLKLEKIYVEGGETSLKTESEYLAILKTDNP